MQGGRETPHPRERIPTSIDHHVREARAVDASEEV